MASRIYNIILKIAVIIQGCQIAYGLAVRIYVVENFLCSSNQLSKISIKVHCKGRSIKFHESQGKTSGIALVNVYFQSSSTYDPLSQIAIGCAPTRILLGPALCTYAVRTYTYLYAIKSKGFEHINFDASKFKRIIAFARNHC